MLISRKPEGSGRVRYREDYCTRQLDPSLGKDSAGRVNSICHCRDNQDTYQCRRSPRHQEHEQRDSDGQLSSARVPGEDRDARSEVLAALADKSEETSWTEEAERTDGTVEQGSDDDDCSNRYGGNSRTRTQARVDGG